jgi:hypothetical protein
LFCSTECVLTVHQEDSRTSNADGRLLVAYLFSVSSGLKPSFGLEVTRVKRYMLLSPGRCHSWLPGC